MTRAAVLAVAVALLAPAAASAQAPPAPAPAPPPPPAPAPAPPPPPPVPQITLAAQQVHTVRDTALVLRGDTFQVSGAMVPAAPGEQVELRLSRDGRQYRRVPVAVNPDGTFALAVRARRAGRLSVRAVHAATPQLGAARGPKVRVAVADARASAGLRSPLVRLLQRGLARLRYATSRSGTYDDATGRAVMAFRKVNGMARSYAADRAVVRRVLAGKGGFRVRRPHAGRHVEADLSRQVLALIEGRRVVATYHTSTGAGATPTVIGDFRVYLKTPGTNAKGMVHSSYFIRGYAIHGYVDVPAFNASHGCLRVPIPNAWRIYQWLRMGDRVIVYP